MRTLRIGLAQVNMTVGDLNGNARKILKWAEEARRKGVALLLFPELAVTGYPPEDLLLKPAFIRDNLKALDKIRRGLKAPGMVTVLGFVDGGDDIRNAAAVIHRGKVLGVYHKRRLPNYGVFDEDRYFQKGEQPLSILWGDLRVGVSICEDIWYPGGPSEEALRGQAELIVNLSSSPYHLGKSEQRERMLRTRATDGVAIVAYVNLVGGQDELLFDGGSTIYDPDGQVIARGKLFEEDLVIADLDFEEVFRLRLHDPRSRKEKQAHAQEADRTIWVTVPGAPPTPARRRPIQPRVQPRLAPAEEVLRALVLGTRDYVQKNGFGRVLVGLSGGVDSALVAALAVEALGKKAVVGVSMPGPFTSRGTRSDAAKVAKNLGIEFIEIPIGPVFQAYLRELKPVFKGKKPDVAEENLQARIRGNYLMALSNKFGWLVLTTGNKSELATGYCTLYGDMAGGFAVIKDVPKTMVYAVAEVINAKAGWDCIPKSVLERAPTAELRANQTDQDTLPPYAELDPIVTAYVEEDLSFEEMTAKGAKPSTVKQVIRMIDGNEYKRRQGPPGIKITERAFGKDWRLPITNRYRKD
jgi:NAD+ synthase (glutamine-hydrolysing)